MYADILKQSGYKLTRPRQLILEYLKKNEHPIAAGDIYKALKNKIDKVTVYRILGVFEKLGIVFKEFSGKEFLYYLSGKQHHHIICQKCGYSQCIPCSHVFKGIKNFKNIKHHLVLTGLCNKCSK
ncbi:transcriptional repressor [Patescibacteria group bacterium]|nr:transcriptional repressor [Patescibacteria group bacterium]